MIEHAKLLTIRSRDGAGVTFRRSSDGQQWYRLLLVKRQLSIVCLHCGGAAPLNAYLKRNARPKYYAKCKRCGHVHKI